jgi:hypothetical protein
MIGTALPNPVVISGSGLLTGDSGRYLDGYEDEPTDPDSQPGGFEAVANCAPTGGG